MDRKDDFNALKSLIPAQGNEGTRQSQKQRMVSSWTSNGLLVFPQLKPFNLSAPYATELMCVPVVK